MMDMMNGGEPPFIMSIMFILSKAVRREPTRPGPQSRVPIPPNF